MTPDEKLKAELELADVKSVMSLPAGRRFVWSLLDACGVWSASFRESSQRLSDVLEGRRSVGLMLMQHLQQKLAREYSAMVLEAAQAEADELARRDLEAAKTDP